MIWSFTVKDNQTCCTHCGNRIPFGMRARKKIWFTFEDPNHPRTKAVWICPLCTLAGKRFKGED